MSRQAPVHGSIGMRSCCDDRDIRDGVWRVKVAAGGWLWGCITTHQHGRGVHNHPPAGRRVHHHPTCQASGLEPISNVGHAGGRYPVVLTVAETAPQAARCGFIVHATPMFHM
jgi:hypothetical protein